MEEMVHSICIITNLICKIRYNGTYQYTVSNPQNITVLQKRFQTFDWNFDKFLCKLILWKGNYAKKFYR